MDIQIGLIICVLLQLFASYKLSEASTPEQIHISLGDSLNSTVVMWSSSENLPYKVNYGKSRDNMILQTGSDIVHQPRQAELAVPFVYRAVLKNLTRGTRYFYKIRLPVSSNKTLQFESEIFRFSTPANSQVEPYRYLVYGDMGTADDIPTYGTLETLADSGNYTAVLHVGDFAYDLQGNSGKVGDKFFNRIQPFASRLPYMPSPGNHEMADDFLHYRTRFSTPNTPWPIPLDKLWYSFNVGPVHFIRTLDTAAARFPPDPSPARITFPGVIRNNLSRFRSPSVALSASSKAAGNGFCGAVLNLIKMKYTEFDVEYFE